jgi:hypothetical protein
MTTVNKYLLLDGAIWLEDMGIARQHTSLYHSLYRGEVAEKLYEVRIAPFRWTDYFPNEGDPVWDLLKNLFRAKKEYKRLTIADLQRGIENKELEL